MDLKKEMAHFGYNGEISKLSTFISVVILQKFTPKNIEYFLLFILFKIVGFSIQFFFILSPLMEVLIYQIV